MNKLVSLTLLGAMWVAGARAQTCGTTISTFPHLQDFELSTAGAPGALPTGWSISPTTSFRWEIQDGPTTSSSTGPSTDHTTGVAGGKYVYTESSSGSTGAIADLISPCINITSLATPGFDFWYHMHGATTGSMEVQVTNNGGTTWTTLFTLTGEQQTATTDPWIKKTLSLAGYTGTVQIKFKGIRGTSFTSDMAIDDVKFYNIPANDASVTAINAPVSPVQPGVSTPVQVTLKNLGGSALTSATVGFSVNGVVAVNNYSFTGNLTGNQSSAPITIGNYTFTPGTNTIKAWTSNPNGATDGDTSNDTTTVQVVACNALTGTFTINKNVAASGTNYQSIADAVQAINQCGIGGPVVFNVVAGSGPYNEQVNLGIINGVSATNTVTFNGNGNKIAFAGNSSSRATIVLDGTDYTTFTNFLIDATDGTYGWGFHLMNGADNNTISNNTITIASTSTSSVNTAGIALTNSSTSVTSTGNTGNNNIITGNTITGAYTGIIVNNVVTTASNNQLLNNTIQDFYADGIKVNAANGTLVDGNDISRPTRASVTTFTGIEVSGGSIETTVRNNSFHNPAGADPTPTSTAYGIYTTGSDATTGSENVYYNNLIYNMNTNGTIYGIYNNGSAGSHYFHNTFNLDNTSNTGTVRGFYQTGTATNIQFLNNIISMNTGTSGTKYALYFNSTASGITSNNNVIYIAPTTNASVGYYSGARATLADWKLVNSGAFDQNSVAANPVFIDPANGNFSPNTVAVDNIGQALAAVTTDITGTPRNATTPDPGAYEFSVAANDVAVIAISGPASGCGLTATESITITIRNFGSLPQTNIPVNFTVNGVSTGTGTWTGTLAPNATATFTFTQTVDMSNSGAYVIVASTGLTNDDDTANDALTTTIGNSLLPALPVTFDFETPSTSIGGMRVVTNPNSNVIESADAANGTGKGMIMDGIDNPQWSTPAGLTNPWTNNPDHFAGVYMCLTPNTAPKDSLILTFNLKQLYKDSHYHTNFRVTVNGQQIGKTFNPPFGGHGATGPQWDTIRINLESFKHLQNIEIGFESSVKEEYANGNGQANLIDNIRIVKILGPTGIKDNVLQSNVTVYPNPSTGMFNLNVPTSARSYEIEVTDLTGKLVKRQVVSNNSGESRLDLNGKAKGIYILKITSEGNTATRKLIVE